jgi:hypothetical protein
VTRWTPARERAVKAKVAVYGLRVVCLGCGWQGRWFTMRATPGHEGPALEVGCFNEEERSGGAPTFKRLRDARCPRCQRYEAVRSRYWVARWPDRAAQVKRRILALDRVLE